MVVESDSKAEKISKFLGNQYVVLATRGHVRALPPKEGAVDPESDFEMKWQSLSQAIPRLHKIEQALRDCHTILVATDPDREGEAISWHVLDILASSGALQGKHVRRVTFTEVTEDAIRRAVQSPREVSQDLVDAYRARLGLDFLVGFSVSPLLWRKVPGAHSKSAGRVQSVALRLIAEREAEREGFCPVTHWSIHVLARGPNGLVIPLRLTKVDGKPASGPGAFQSREEAEATAERLRSAALSVSATTAREERRQPQAPFVTSTLQRVGCNQLGMGVSRVMQAAQKLYEGPAGQEGLITYMRTDGTDLAPEAITALRGTAQRLFSPRHVPKDARVYRKKAKNAQEAHEAIRPTKPGLLPWTVPSSMGLSSDQLRVYDLIWRRALACQMAPAVLEQLSVDVEARGGAMELRGSGTRELFEGFRGAYRINKGKGGGGEGGEGGGETDADDEFGPSTSEAAKAISLLEKGQQLQVVSVDVKEHVTSPPPRYNDGSLVQKMEELGIGRPSTYAATIELLQKRGYVHPRRGGRGPLVPTAVGRLTVEYLKECFPEYVEYEFTAEMEAKLDEISAGTRPWRDVLGSFWGPFAEAVTRADQVDRKEVLVRLGERFAPLLFPAREDGSDATACPRCRDGRLELKVMKTGAAFLGCSKYGDKSDKCNYSLPVLGPDWAYFRNSLTKGIDQGLPRDMGTHPDLGYRMYLKAGPYGIYIEMETPNAQERVNVPDGADLEELTSDKITALINAKRGRIIGKHPETEEMMTLRTGKYGPYIDCAGIYASVPKSVFSEGGPSLEQAIELVTKKMHKMEKEGGGDVDRRSQKAPSSRGKKTQSSSKVPEAKKGPKTQTKSQKGTKSRSGTSTADMLKAEGVKRARSAYIFFGMEERSKVLAESPGLSIGEVAKALGERWQALGPEHKAKFEAMAREDKLRYQREVAEVEEKMRKADPREGE